MCFLMLVWARAPSVGTSDGARERELGLGPVQLQLNDSFIVMRLHAWPKKVEVYSYIFLQYLLVKFMEL